MNEADLDRLKAEARRRARAIRAVAANAHAATALARTFPEALKGPGVVAGYWPLGSEIDCRPLMAALEAAGAMLALPRVPDRSGQVEFRLWRRGEDLDADAFGMMAPTAAAALACAPRLVLCPLLAFDRAGGRLGQGGGHYDRVLAMLKPQGALAVGLGFAAQEIAAAPMGALDQRLDWIVTESEAIEVASV